MMKSRIKKGHLLSTLVAVAGVNPVTFNSWRKRNGLFPWTEKEKGWKLYSVADIMATYTVNGLIKSGCVTQFAVDAATALLPRFEEMVAGEGEEVFEKPVALIMQHNHADDDQASTTDIEYYSPAAPIGAAVIGRRDHGYNGRLAWGSAIVVDLGVVFLDVDNGLAELQPDTVMDEDETSRFVASSLAEAVRPRRDEQ